MVGYGGYRVESSVSTFSLSFFSLLLTSEAFLSKVHKESKKKWLFYSHFLLRIKLFSLRWSSHGKTNLKLASEFMNGFMSREQPRW